MNHILTKLEEKKGNDKVKISVFTILTGVFEVL